MQDSLITRNTSRHSLLPAIIANAIIMAVFLSFTHMHYGSNDDFSLALAIVHDGYFYFPLTNYFLNGFVWLVQQITPFWNAWIGCQIVFSFLAFTGLSYVFFEKGKNSLWIKALGVCIPLIFAFDHYTEVQFTQTSALLMVSGAILMAFSITKEDSRKTLFIGGVLFFFGTLYRFHGVYAVLYFLAAFAVYSAVLHRQELRTLLLTRNLKRYRIFAVAAVIAVSFAANAVSEKVEVSSPELKSYIEYNLERGQFQDYARPYYFTHEAFYQELGINENDFVLMTSWFLDSDTVASYENLKAINKLQSELTEGGFNFQAVFVSFIKDSYYRIEDLSHGKRGLNTLFLIALTLLILAVTRFKAWPLYILFGIGYFALYMYLLYQGRMDVYRATYVIDIAAIAWCAFCVRPENIRAVFQNAEDSRRRLKKFASGITSAAMIVVVVMALNHLSYLSFTPHSKEHAQTSADQLLEYFIDHPKEVFILSRNVNFRNSLHNYQHPAAPLPEVFPGNYFAFAGWEMTSPYEQDRMEEIGINNIYGDIVDNSAVYVIDTKEGISQKERFFNDHYAKDGKIIYFESAGEVYGYQLYHVRAR